MLLRPLHFFDDLLQPSGMGSSGIDLVGFGFRLSLPAAVIVVPTPTTTAL
jgi:hypothetical protein